MFANARVSPIALLAQKGFPSLLLDTQYRMCPAISLFPSHQFYGGLLKDHPEARKDNEMRQKMREISKSFGIYGPGQRIAQASKKGKKKQRKQEDNRQGSEYLVINVKYGTSRIEKNGTSLVNFANAHAVIAVIDRMLQQKIDPARIKILAYYNGQMRLIQKMLKDIDPESEENFTAEAEAAIEVSSVGSFQGRESDVFIVELVAAKDPVLAKGARNAQKE